jgi:hypothetical protein
MLTEMSHGMVEMTADAREIHQATEVTVQLSSAKAGGLAIFLAETGMFRT